METKKCKKCGETEPVTERSSIIGRPCSKTLIKTNFNDINIACSIKHIRIQGKRENEFVISIFNISNPGRCRTIDIGYYSDGNLQREDLPNFVYRKYDEICHFLNNFAESSDLNVIMSELKKWESHKIFIGDWWFMENAEYASWCSIDEGIDDDDFSRWYSKDSKSKSPIHLRLSSGEWMDAIQNNRNHFFVNYLYAPMCDDDDPENLDGKFDFSYRGVGSYAFNLWHKSLVMQDEPYSDQPGWMANTEEELEIVNKELQSTEVTAVLTTIGELAEDHRYIGVMAKNGSIFDLDDEDFLEDDTVIIHTLVKCDGFYFIGSIHGIPANTKCIGLILKSVLNTTSDKTTALKNKIDHNNLTQEELNFLLDTI